MTEENVGEEFTPEESAALAEMKGAPAPEAADPKPEPAPAPEPDPSPADPEKAPEPLAAEGDGLEFKSTREKPPEGFVPHQAMHAERMARQELQRKLEALEARLEAAQKPAEQEPQYVDPLVDPEGYRKWDEHRYKQLQDKVAADRAEREQAAQFEAKRARVLDYERTFSEKQPDYNDASDFLLNARRSELFAMGLDEQTVRQQIAQDIDQIVTAAESIGMNPAQLAYMRAQDRGYKRAEPKPAVDEAAKITALAKAQAETQGVKSGGEPQTGYTAAQLADMSEEEFNAVPANLRKRAMGG